MNRVTSIPPDATPSVALAMFDACATPVEDKNGSSELVAQCECGGQRYESFPSYRVVPCAEIISIICREIRIGSKSVLGLVPHCRNFGGGSWSFSDTRVAAEVFAADFGLKIQPYSGPFDVLGRNHCQWDTTLDRSEYEGLRISRSHVENEPFPCPFVRSLRGDNDWYLQIDIDKWWERVLSQARADKRAEKVKAVQRRSLQGCIYLIWGCPLDKAGPIGYIGQTVNYEARKHAHLVRGDHTTASLLETFRAKGVTPQMKIVKKCSQAALDAEEARWYRTYKDSGWILWNRTELTGALGSSQRSISEL